jgi:hypothetical protein
MPVRTANDLASAVKLFRAYASSLEVDLSYQDFEAEMEAMPGKYAPPAGELLLAHYSKGTPVGCVGLRPIEPQGCCEMKRLYVSPEGRGFGSKVQLAHGGNATGPLWFCYDGTWQGAPYRHGSKQGAITGICCTSPPKGGAGPVLCFRMMKLSIL